VPLLRVRPNTSADAARDYLPGTEGGRCVSRRRRPRLRLADNFARERETLIEIYYCACVCRGDDDFRAVSSYVVSAYECAYTERVVVQMTHIN